MRLDMRKKIVAGNWKMNNDLNSSAKLISELKNGIQTKSGNTEIVICPPFTSLETAATLVKNSVIRLGAQNMYWEESGAFTGEVSPEMLKSVGCEFVIIGHSERRAIFGEENSLLNKKIASAIKHNLLPIYCVGETLEERESGITFKVIEKQIREGLSSFTAADLKNLVIAYEPVWAIGTGKTASPQQAQEVHAFIRKLIAEIFGKELAEGMVIQYGGSVKPDNAAELMSQPDIDGALVGGACLKADSFIKIIEAAN